MLVAALQNFSSSAAGKADESKKFLLQAQFGSAISMYHGFGLLKNHGLKSCQTFLRTFAEKEVKEKVSCIFHSKISSNSALIVVDISVA